VASVKKLPFVFSLQLAGAQPLGINLGLLGDQPLNQLFVRHFQRENGHVFLMLLGSNSSPPKEEAGLARSGRPAMMRRSDFCKPAKQFIQVDETGGDAKDFFIALRHSETWS